MRSELAGTRTATPLENDIAPKEVATTRTEKRRNREVTPPIVIKTVRSKSPVKRSKHSAKRSRKDKSPSQSLSSDSYSETSVKHSSRHKSSRKHKSKSTKEPVILDLKVNTQVDKPLESVVVDTSSREKDLLGKSKRHHRSKSPLPEIVFSPPGKTQVSKKVRDNSPELDSGSSDSESEPHSKEYIKRHRSERSSHRYKSRSPPPKSQTTALEFIRQ